MRRFRFSIGSLIGFILICGVAVAALKESSDWWEKGTFSVTLLILLTSVLLAIHRAGAPRQFWLGFALFGSVYLGLSLIPPIESRLVTSGALSFLHSKLPGQAPDTLVLTVSTSGSVNSAQQNGTLVVTSNGAQLAAGGKGSIRLWSAATGKLLAGWGESGENFVKIGHCLVALSLGWFGGMISRRLARGRRLSEE